ncbi:MAG: PD-(D/E)XK nuclease family protein [Nitrospirae bacterium]|nr:PD-(D/E)XK nuclease family protein [Nitrospirota bacterium]
MAAPSSSITNPRPCRIRKRPTRRPASACSSKDEDDLEKTTATILKAADGIRAQNFAATPAYLACQYCAYREICPHTARG